MGLSSENDYLKGYVNKSFNDEVLRRLDTCVNALRNDSVPDAMTRWFGENTPDLRNSVRDRLQKLRSVINNTTVLVAFMPLSARDMDENAAAARGDRINQNPLATQIHGYTHNGVTAAVFTNEGFFKDLPNELPLAGGIVDSGGDHQSKFETIIHELTHYFFNTDDDECCLLDADGDPDTAYGSQLAETLAATNPAHAQNNAENWGIFVEAVGRETH